MPMSPENSVSLAARKATRKETKDYGRRKLWRRNTIFQKPSV